MKVTGFFHRFFCLLLVLMLLIPAALADKVDLSSMTDDEIVELCNQVASELVNRGIEKSATLPSGKYTGGKDLPAGSYVLVCKTDDSHHGIVWVSSPDDDLNNQYPSILYDHVSFNSEEEYRFTLEEGGILNLPFTATLTISKGILFR